MSVTPHTWEAPARPAWVDHMRNLLAEREQSATAPVEAEPAHPSNEDMLARTAAFAWLGLRGADAAKELQKIFGNQAGVRLTWNLGSGVDPVASLLITVWAGDEALFSYVLKIPVFDGVCHPKVQAHASNGAGFEGVFLPWTLAGGNLEAITADDVASDFARLFAELVPA